jgi:hypothetical protein
MLAETQNLWFEGNNFVANDKFLRRIHPDWLKQTGQISSAAFDNYRMSTNWMKLSSVEETLSGFENYGVAAVSANLCWSLKQKIESTPVENNVAHCDIVGNKTESIKKKFRDGAEYLVLPKKLT